MNAKPVPTSLLISVFTRPVYESILRKIEQTEEYTQFKSWYDSKEQKIRLSFLEKLYLHVHDNKHTETISSLGIEKLLEDKTDKSTLLILSHCVQEMHNVPCRDKEKTSMDVRKARYRNMAQYIESILSKNYTQKPIEPISLQNPMSFNVMG